MEQNQPSWIAGLIWGIAEDMPRDPPDVRIDCEISFTRHSCRPQPLRTLAEIHADILALEAETEGLLDELIASV